MTDPMQQARELSSPDEIAFRLRNLAQNMAAGSGPVARDHQAWKRVEELAEAVAALRAAPELLEALEPFAHATLTHTGQVIGLMREDFERAIAAIAKATGEPANSHGAGVSDA